MKIPLSHLREKHNITITAYLDDLLLIANSPTQLLSAIDITQNLLRSLGFFISVKKSVIMSTKNLQFLGFFINSETMHITLGAGKAADIKAFIADTLKQPLITIRHLAAVLGKLAATLPGNRYGQIFIKRLEKEKAKALKAKAYNYEGTLTL